MQQPEELLDAAVRRDGFGGCAASLPVSTVRTLGARARDPKREETAWPKGRDSLEPSTSLQ
jgi:hypothetical protein